MLKLCVKKRQTKTCDDYTRAYKKHTGQYVNEPLERFIRKIFVSGHLKNHVRKITTFDLMILNQETSKLEKYFKEEFKKAKTVTLRPDLYIYDVETSLSNLIETHMAFCELLKKLNIVDRHANLLENIRKDIEKKLKLYRRYEKEKDYSSPDPDIEYLQDNPPKNPTKLIILLHGMGGRPRDWNARDQENHYNYIEMMGLRDSKDTLCIAIKGRVPFYFGTHRGQQYIDLESVTLDDKGHLDTIQARVKTQARPYIFDKIREILKNHKSIEKIAFGGISLGAIVGLDAITHLSEENWKNKVKGGFFISGAFDNRDGDGDAKDMKFLLIHNNRDRWVEYERAETAQKKLLEIKADDVEIKNGAPSHIPHKENEEGETAPHLAGEWILTVLN